MKTVYVVWTTVDDRTPTTTEIEVFGTYDKALDIGCLNMKTTTLLKSTSKKEK